MIGAILNSLSIVGFASLYQAINDSKRVPQLLDNANVATSSIGYCLSICSIVLLPLTWLDLALRSIRMRSSRVLLIIVFSVVFTIITLGVQLPLSLVSISNYRGVSSGILAKDVAIAWIVILTAILGVNLAALIKVSMLYNSTRNSSSTCPDRRGRQTIIHKLLRRIQVAAVQLCFASIATMVSFCVFGFLRLAPPRIYYSDPRCFWDYQNLVWRFGRLFVLYGCTVCVWFVFEPVWSIHTAVFRVTKEQEVRQEQSSDHVDS